MHIDQIGTNLLARCARIDDRVVIAKYKNVDFVRRSVSQQSLSYQFSMSKEISDAGKQARYKLTRERRSVFSVGIIFERNIQVRLRIIVAQQHLKPTFMRW